MNLVIFFCEFCHFLRILTFFAEFGQIWQIEVTKCSLRGHQVVMVGGGLFQITIEWFSTLKPLSVLLEFRPPHVLIKID